MVEEKRQFYNTFEIFLEKLFNGGVQFYLVKYDLLAKGEKTRIKDLSLLLSRSIELIEFSYFSLKNNDFTIHALIGVRSLIGKNESILLSLKDRFLDKKNIEVYQAKNVEDLRKMFRYTVKGLCLDNHVVTFNASKCFDLLLPKMLDDLIVLGVSEVLEYAIYKTKWNQIPHFQGSNVLINLFNLYFHLEHLTIQNNEICKNGMKYVSMDFLKQNHRDIIERVTKEFPMQLNNYRFPIHESLNSTIQLVEEIPSLLIPSFYTAIV